MAIPERNRRALAAAKKAAGSQYRLAKCLGINAQSIQQWGQIPAERVVEIERLTQIPREHLRPDLYLTGRPRGLRAPMFHVTAALHSRIDEALKDGEDATGFIRAAIERELERRGIPSGKEDEAAEAA